MRQLFQELWLWTNLESSCFRSKARLIAKGYSGIKPTWLVRALQQSSAASQAYGLMPAALIIGHHFSISAFCNLARLSALCWSGGNISCPRSASRCRVAGLANVATTAALSFSIMSLGVPLGAQSPCQYER